MRNRNEKAMFFVQKLDYGEHVYIHLGIKNTETGQIAEAQTVVMETRERDSAMSPTPMLDISDSEATNLMDALWNAGIRPHNYQGSGQLESMRDHLKDMRTIVSKMLKVDL